jgi:hypothetical protein
MPDASTYGLFVVAALALLLVPGPAVVYVVARSVEGGRPAGLVSVLGVEMGPSSTSPSPPPGSPRSWPPPRRLSPS